MDCKKILQELNLYIDGELDKDLCLQLETHLKDCDRCRIVLDTTKKTIEIYRGSELYELPDYLRSRLHTAILSKCQHKKKSGPADA